MDNFEEGEQKGLQNQPEQPEKHNERKNGLSLLSRIIRDMADEGATITDLKSMMSVFTGTQEIKVINQEGSRVAMVGERVKSALVDDGYVTTLT